MSNIDLKAPIPIGNDLDIAHNFVSLCPNPFSGNHKYTGRNAMTEKSWSKTLRDQQLQLRENNIGDIALPIGPPSICDCAVDDT